MGDQGNFGRGGQQNRQYCKTGKFADKHEWVEGSVLCSRVWLKPRIHCHVSSCGVPYFSHTDLFRTPHTQLPVCTLYSLLFTQLPPQPPPQRYKPRVETEATIHWHGRETIYGDAQRSFDLRALPATAPTDCLNCADPAAALQNLSHLHHLTPVRRCGHRSCEGSCCTATVEHPLRHRCAVAPARTH